ncbi:hypothetical protein ACMAV4_04230 [Helicobacter pylori]
MWCWWKIGVKWMIKSWVLKRRSDTGKFIEVTCKEKRNPGELVKVEIISHSKGRLIAAIKGN